MTMPRHPNLERIDALQGEIKRLSDEVAAPLLEEFFALADEAGIVPNISQFARESGVKPSWFSKRLHSDQRYQELVTRIRMWCDMENDTFSLSDIS